MPWCNKWWHIDIMTQWQILLITPLSTRIIHWKSVDFGQYLWCLTQTQQIFSKSVVLESNTTDFSKFVVFESNTTIFSKTWFELYFIIVFSHLCLHRCFFVCPFCLSPIFCSDCSKLCSVAASVRKIGNYYDDFDSNTSLWPCGIRIWANTRHKYANTQIQKRSPRHFDTVHFSP